MQFLQKYRFWLAGIVVVIAGIALISLGWQKFHPLPEVTEFKTRYYSFMYQRTYDAKEYAPGVVSLGHDNKQGGIDPLIEVTRYQSDPDVATPTAFDTFMKRQAGALCGADGPIESVTCTQVGVSATTTATGIKAQQLALTLIRKNLKSGTTTTSTYGPLYVFNTTGPATSTPDSPFRYSAIFVYPSLSAYLNLATTSPVLMDEIMNTFTIATSTKS